jgi:hypothetical protein
VKSEILPEFMAVEGCRVVSVLLPFPPLILLSALPIQVWVYTLKSDNDSVLPGMDIGQLSRGAKLMVNHNTQLTCLLLP